MNDDGERQDYDYNPNNQYYYPNGEPFNPVSNDQTQQTYTQSNDEQPIQNQQSYQYQNPNQGQPFNPNTQNNNSSGDSVAVASMVCGILSIVPCCCGVYGIIFGIAAIVLYVYGKDNVSEASKTKLKAGLICGIIGIILGVAFIFISTIVDMAELANTAQNNFNV